MLTASRGQQSEKLVMSHDPSPPPWPSCCTLATCPLSLSLSPAPHQLSHLNAEPRRTRKRHNKVAGCFHQLPHRWGTWLAESGLAAFLSWWRPLHSSPLRVL